METVKKNFELHEGLGEKYLEDLRGVMGCLFDDYNISASVFVYSSGKHKGKVESLLIRVARPMVTRVFFDSVKEVNKKYKKGLNLGSVSHYETTMTFFYDKE